MRHLASMWRCATTSRLLSRVSGQGTTYDEKNIRRRVYDALNVLMAMDIITKDRKEISWRGLPSNSKDELEALRVSHLARRCWQPCRAAGWWSSRLIVALASAARPHYDHPHCGEKEGALEGVAVAST